MVMHARQANHDRPTMDTMPGGARFQELTSPESARVVDLARKRGDCHAPQWDKGFISNARVPARRRRDMMWSRHHVALVTSRTTDWLAD